MLAWHIVEEIRSRLSAGEAYRRIAREVGVARGTVHQIARNRHRWRPTQRAREEWEHPELPQGPYCRCESCGGMVQHPCLRCRLQESAAHRELGVDTTLFSGVRLGLELREEHLRRYEQVRLDHERQLLQSRENPDWENSPDYRSPHLLK